VDEIAFGRRYSEVCERGDHEAYARLLAEHPEFVANREGMRVILHMHARAGETEFVRALLDAGVDVNLTEDDRSLKRAISGAVLAGSAEMVRLLLDRGSDVNWATSEHPIECDPLPAAIRDGRLDIVRMLVEAGALLNVVGPAGHTPLSWALAYQRHDIAEYLKAHGALLQHETPSWVPPPPIDPVIQAVRRARIGDLDDPILDEGDFRLLLGLGPGEYDGYVLFTQGMSSRALSVPVGGEAYQYAELVLYLEDVPSTDPGEWRETELGLWWLAEWMRRIARYPFEHNTWLGGKWTILSNEDPPRPLSEHTQMTCWLLLGEKEPLARAELPDGKSVCFYTMMPIHTAERDLALSEGLVALLERFAEHDVSVRLDPDRPSVV
jgi:hypothetical protein